MVKKLLDIRLPPLNIQWVSNLPPALVSSIIITITSTAAVSMIFKEDLTAYLSIGISCALIGAVIVNMISKFVCVFPFAISCMTPNAAVVMGLFFTEIHQIGLAPQDQFYTIFTAFVLTCLLTAIMLAVVGTLKIGKLIRYMPYPVMCGFFAGVGWYLFLGAFTIMGIDIRDLKWLEDTESITTNILPPVLFALLIFFIQRKYKSPFNYIGLLGLSVIAFYAVFMIKGLPLQDVSKSTLTVHNPEIEFLIEHINPSAFLHIHWNEILVRWPYIVTFAIVNLLSLLAYAVNFEETSHTSADLDREVKFVGYSNIVATLFTGGTSIFTTQSLSHRASGGNHSISVLYVSLFCTGILLFSDVIIPYIPKFVVSGVLITNGLFLIYKWLFKTVRKISWDEVALIAIIFIVMIFQGFIQGVAVGLALAFILFIYNNSRGTFIRYETSGSDYLSNVAYPLEKIKVLRKYGGKIHLMKLQGFLFFGSAERLQNYIKQEILTRTDPKVQFLIIDFSYVTDIDSTAIHSLIKLETMLHLRGCYLILTGLNKKSRKHLGMAAKAQRPLEFALFFESVEVKTKSGKLYIFEDVDSGLEWAERKILKQIEESQRLIETKDFWGYSEFLKTQKEIDLFVSYLKKIKLKKGDTVMSPKKYEESLYFIESGSVAYLMRKKTRGYKRIREFGPGHIIGEFPFYLNKPLDDMKIVCVKDCVFYKLDRAGMNKLEEKHPKIALKFTNWITGILSERLNHLTKEMRHLS